jgi:hypothetical protein
MGEDRGGGEKELTTPLILALSRKGRGDEGKNDFNGTPHFLFSIGGERKKVKKISSRASSPLMGEDRGGGESELTAPLTLTLSRRGRGKQRKII